MPPLGGRDRQRERNAMRRAVAGLSIIVSCAFAASSAAGVAVVAQNLPIEPSPSNPRLDGTFSDGLQSAGGYFYSQAFGQGFSLSGSGTLLSNLTVWGSSEFTNGNPSGNSGVSANITRMQVSIMRVSGSTGDYPMVANWSIPIGQVTQTNTGWLVDGILTPVFRMDMVLADQVTLAAGNYILSVGAILEDPDGDAWVWMDGVADGSLPSTQAYLTVGDFAPQWGYWDPVNSGVSGAMVLYGVPAPGALALLGLAGLRQGRRRS
jgi:hypothetical protein